MSDLTRRDFLKKTSLASFLALSPASEELLKLSKRFPKSSKGIIFLVGDGWPLGVMKAYMEYARRVFKIEPNLSKLLQDSRTRVSLSVTNSLSSVVTDSAPASVAWATGSKTANRLLASLPDGKKLKTIAELAKDKGMGLGFVTTTRITHATPAGWYSHHLNRDAEDEVALDLLALKPDVAMGGGLRHFLSDKRIDKRDLIAKFRGAGYQVVQTREELKKASLSRPVLGLFADSHLSFYIDRINDRELSTIQPTLPEMTAVALSILGENPKGFVLQIEAGRIDHACHNNDVAGALYDTYEMDMTLGVVLSFLEINPHVLLIVTSDHGNSMFGINGTGPEYNHSTEALLKYQKAKASFEYIKAKMRGKSPQEIQSIMAEFTGFSDITVDEAQEIHHRLNNPPLILENDFWYEPEATMGRILSKSRYRTIGQGKRGTLPEKMEALVRRGNIYFTGTNHTAEDQLLVVRSQTPIKNLPARSDNTYVFKLMCDYLNIRYENPKMTEEEYIAKYTVTIKAEEWEKHLALHVS
ncbi:MAG: alkaline phosphatase [Caldimicrobium sp.]|nr:alkaline phosphatase [Caldimicrobium sp.]MCX7613792.1 alkaline phosphatase [Caldimicrobium sp.]MDW8182619.1 alkaline phosphatase [Caldimicrobium sp.]